MNSPGLNYGTSPCFYFPLSARMWYSNFPSHCASTEQKCLAGNIFHPGLLLLKMHMPCQESNCVVMEKKCLWFRPTKPHTHSHTVFLMKSKYYSHQIKEILYEGSRTFIIRVLHMWLFACIRRDSMIHPKLLNLINHIMEYGIFLKTP